MNKGITIVVIGGSAGSIKSVKSILIQLNTIKAPTNFSFMIGLHRPKNDDSSALREVLQYSSKMPVVEPEDGADIETSKVYLAPADYHLVIEANAKISLSSSPLVHYSRPSIDILFMSAAEIYSTNVVGILLSGANRDGATGMKYIKELGGITVVQEPSDCFIDTMPKAALASTTIDHVLTAENIGLLLKKWIEKNGLSNEKF